MNSKFKLQYIKEWEANMSYSSKLIEKNNQTIERLRSSTQFTLTFRTKQIESLNEKNAELLEKIKYLRQNLIDIEDSSSSFYKSLMDQIEKNTIEFHQIEDEKKNRKKEKKPILNKKEQKKLEDRQKKQLVKKELNNRSNNRSNHRSNHRSNNESSQVSASKRSKQRVSRRSSYSSIDHDLRKYYEDDLQMPEYMRRNLETMPYNKGYIWRNSWYFGKKAEEVGKPLILFEKKKGFLYIHEISDKSVTIFKKNGKEKRKFVSCTPRRIIE